MRRTWALALVLAAACADAIGPEGTIETESPRKKIRVDAEPAATSGSGTDASGSSGLEDASSGTLDASAAAAADGSNINEDAGTPGVSEDARASDGATQLADGGSPAAVDAGTPAPHDATVADATVADAAVADATPPIVVPDAGLPGPRPGDRVQFDSLPPLRSRSNASWGAALTDILQHLPPGGDPYYDSDDITWGHETTHGINSHLRSLFWRSGTVINGFYVMQNRAVIVEEPAIRKSDVIPFVPQSLRGSRYSLYIAGQEAWDDRPLYIFDEWIAYTNGGEVGVDQQVHGLWTGGGRDGVAGQLEFTIYALALAMAVEQLDPTYFQQNLQFRELLAWNARRAMDLYRQGVMYPEFQISSQERLRQALINSTDAGSMRAFTRRVFGADWALEVLGF